MNILQTFTYQPTGLNGLDSSPHTFGTLCCTKGEQNTITFITIFLKLTLDISPCQSVPAKGTGNYRLDPQLPH